MDARRPQRWACIVAVIAALVVGGRLVVDAALASSATYDEVAYLEIAAAWWRHGEHERIARMGSPATFFKLQQGPVFWALDRAGYGVWIDDPIGNQARLLPVVRVGSLWVWAAGLILTALWAALAHGPAAMAFAAWMAALSPNLIAHGSLVTMEAPLLAATAAVGLLWTRFLQNGSRAMFAATAAVAGLAFSCKFTAVLFPLLLGLSWLAQSWARGDATPRTFARVAAAMLGLVALMALSNIVVTAGARIPLSEQEGEHPAISELVGPGLGRVASDLVEWPIPQDWAAFARQVQHQRSGGPSYLLGERRQTGWWYYYAICLAVKVPVSVWFLVLARAWLGRGRTPGAADRLAVTWIVASLVIVALGSSRNYGYRYLLFLAPAAIVWISAAASWGRAARLALLVGLAGQGIAVRAIHPHELSYFNALCGGPEGGKHVLGDSNLDWGQGARSLARLQRREPRFRDLTLFFFGATDPASYGVVGTRHVIDAHRPLTELPGDLGAVTSRYIAVSRSLERGPWGPEGYFEALRGVEPVRVTDDHTIAVYRTEDLEPSGSGPGLSPPAGAGWPGRPASSPNR